MTKYNLETHNWAGRIIDFITDKILGLPFNILEMSNIAWIRVFLFIVGFVWFAISAVIWMLPILILSIIEECINVAKGS